MPRSLCLAFTLFLVAPGVRRTSSHAIKGDRPSIKTFRARSIHGSQATQPPPPAQSVAPRVPAEASVKTGAVVPLKETSALDDDKPLAGMTAAEVMSSSWGQPKHVMGTADSKDRPMIWLYDGNRKVVFNSKGQATKVIPEPEPE